MLFFIQLKVKIRSKNSITFLRGLLGELARVEYELDWMDLWDDLDVTGRARLASATGQGGGAILTMDATQQGLQVPPDQYMLSVRRMLGMAEPLCAHATGCRACGQALETAELAVLHFPSCPGACALGAGATDLYGTQLVHGALKRGMARVLAESGATPLQEVPGLLAGGQERPGDVVVLNYMESNQTLAVDVSCSRIVCATHVVSAAEAPLQPLEEAETRKLRMYSERCRTARIHFVPFIMDEYGHIGPMGRAFLQGLAERTASSRIASGASTEIWAVLAQRLQRTWEGYMSVELHSSMAKVVMMLSGRAVQGVRN
jgi:hypothetical protein